jgi:hypothetical protein
LQRCGGGARKENQLCVCVCVCVCVFERSRNKGVCLSVTIFARVQTSTEFTTTAAATTTTTTTHTRATLPLLPLVSDHGVGVQCFVPLISLVPLYPLLTSLRFAFSPSLFLSLTHTHTITRIHNHPIDQRLSLQSMYSLHSFSPSFSFSRVPSGPMCFHDVS